MLPLVFAVPAASVGAPGVGVVVFSVVASWGWGDSSGFLSGTVREVETGFTIKLGYPISVRLVMFLSAPAVSTD